MSNDTQKADQIALHFYTKLFYVVNDARNIGDSNLNSKVDKWVSYSCLIEPYMSLNSVRSCCIAVQFGDSRLRSIYEGRSRTL